MIRKNHIGPLLLLCFSVFLGHNLVPHHHHSELIVSHAGEPCPVEHEDNHTTGDHPAHCHAFNEVVFNKVESSDLSEDSGMTNIHTIAVNPVPPSIQGASETKVYVPLHLSLQVKPGRSPVTGRAPPKSI